MLPVVSLEEVRGTIGAVSLAIVSFIEVWATMGEEEVVAGLRTRIFSVESGAAVEVLSGSDRGPWELESGTPSESLLEAVVRGEDDVVEMLEAVMAAAARKSELRSGPWALWSGRGSSELGRVSRLTICKMKEN